MPTTSLANEERSKKDIRSMLTRVDDFRVLQEQLLAGVAHSHHKVFFFFFFFFVEESLHVHRCQSCQQPERQIKQTTGECRVHSTSYDKGSCFAMA